KEKMGILLANQSKSNSSVPSAVALSQRRRRTGPPIPLSPPLHFGVAGPSPIVLAFVDPCYWELIFILSFGKSWRTWQKSFTGDRRRFGFGDQPIRDNSCLARISPTASEVTARTAGNVIRVFIRLRLNRSTDEAPTSDEASPTAQSSAWASVWA